jgi:integrase
MLLIKDRKNLGAAWKWGRENLEGWPEGPNPFLAIKKYPESREPRYVPPEEDFWSLLKIAEGQDLVMLLTFLHLAARRGEVFSLKWSDVDFDNDRVRLWTRKREGGHHEFDWVPMTQDLRRELRDWWKERLGQNTEDRDHVFVCLTQSPFCDEYLGKPFIHRQHFMRRMCERAGVKAFGFHAIRHLTASILYRKGHPLSVIQAILRHKNPNTTTRYLRSLSLEQVREALEEGLSQPAKVIPLKSKSV